MNPLPRLFAALLTAILLALAGCATQPLDDLRGAAECARTRVARRRRVNVGTAAADLSGWKLVYRSGAGTSDVSLGTLADGTTLAAGGFFLFGGSGYSGGHPADKSFSAGLASAAGGVAIKDADGNIVDSVGWGDATNAFVEGTAAAAPTMRPLPGRATRATRTATTRTPTRRTSPSATQHRALRIRCLSRQSRPSPPAAAESPRAASSVAGVIDTPAPCVLARSGLRSPAKGHDHLKRHRRGGGGIEPCVMTTKDEPDRRLSALVTALSLNRGELDAAALERLLGLIERKPAAPAKS